MKMNSKLKSKDIKVPFEINPRAAPTLEASKMNQKVWAELNHQKEVIDDFRDEIRNFIRENRVGISNLKGEITKVNKRIDEVVAKLLEGE